MRGLFCFWRLFISNFPVATSPLPVLLSSAMTSLPIDHILPDLLRILATNSCAVLQAPPGAGKTTRVPLALSSEPWLAGQSILMLQPRRIAARHAAEFMADQLGEEVGKTVGYTIRFERKTSRATRIEVVTEGILTRRLQSDPELNGIGLVIFDEFHERNIHSDLALALSREVQTALRDDLKILVMSATLDAEPVAALLDNCPVLTSPGKSFPVTTRHVPQPENRTIAESMVRGIRIALGETSGDILAFLPGAGEINRCKDLLSGDRGVDIRPLYGSMPFREQRLAIQPGDKRRVVLATNVAETSLTIDGINTVIDSGWERRPRFDVASGLTRLELKRISTASAIQRRGRAGRLGPGVCYRLWSEGEEKQLLPQAPPEIRTADLAPLVLELANWGETDPQRLSWLDRPSVAQIKKAKDLLEQLAALEGNGQITPIGRKMVRLPVPPRLARLIVAAEAKNLVPLACELAALLSERDLQTEAMATEISDCDLESRWRFLHRNLTTPGARSVMRVAGHLNKLMVVTGQPTWPSPPQPIQRMLVAAWPDRIARGRQPGSDRYLMSDGSGAILSQRSSLPKPPFLIALNLHYRGGQPEITMASTIDQSVIEEQLADRVQQETQVLWDMQEDRVVAREIRTLGDLILSEKPIKPTSEEQVEATLSGIRQLGIDRLGWSGEAQQFLARVRLCARMVPEEDWPDFSSEGLTEDLAEWLAPFLKGVTTRATLERFNPHEALKAMLPWHLQNRLDQLAPERIEVPSGSRIRIDYTAQEIPVLAVKLQELFGLKNGPEILNGKLPLLIHLLSPAGRPLGVTRDLEHFWDKVYPEVRKEMRGRYPKHPWPDDPWNASPTAKTRKKM